MSYSEPDDVEPHTRLTLALAFVTLGAFGYLVFGPGFEFEFAGYGALIALPLCVGALFTLASGYYSPLGCLVAPIGLGILCYILVKLGAEGLVCVVMVMPVWFLAGLGGGLIALFVSRKRRRDETGSTKLNSVGLAILPFALMYVDSVAPASWQQRDVVRSVTVDAPAERIWPLLISIPDVRPDEGVPTLTHDWLGVPRPSDARLVQRDGETVRLARWGNDARFEEIVSGMEEGRWIGWKFAFPDPSLQNRVDRHVSPDGEMLKILTGSYRLQPLADGRTRLTLTTTYAMRSRLDWYFGWWGERMLGDVQDNVLAIVRQRSEAPNQAAMRDLR